MVDLYKTLQVPRNASLAQIKESFRILAMKFHPDLNKGDKSKSEEFVVILSAYNTLSDSKLRAIYDKSIGFNQSSAQKSSNTAWSHSYNGQRTQKASVSPAHFNEKVWRAYHYGEGARRNEAVKNTGDWMSSFQNEHRAYFERKKRREHQPTFSFLDDEEEKTSSGTASNYKSKQEKSSTNDCCIS